jgi:hypothetical protein
VTNKDSLDTTSFVILLRGQEPGSSSQEINLTEVAFTSSPKVCRFLPGNSLLTAFFALTARNYDLHISRDAKIPHGRR